MKYVVFQLVPVIKNLSRGEYASALEALWPDKTEFDTKEEAIEKVKELKAVKFSYERNFVIIEVW